MRCWASVGYLFAALEAFEKGAIVGKDVDGLWFGGNFGSRQGCGVVGGEHGGG